MCGWHPHIAVFPRALTRTSWSYQIGMTDLSLAAADAERAFERVEANTEFNRSARRAVPSAFPDQPDTARRCPPLIIKPDEVDEMLHLFAQGLKTVEAKPSPSGLSH
jgi:hypothetical protein